MVWQGWGGGIKPRVGRGKKITNPVAPSNSSCGISTSFFPMPPPPPPEPEASTLVDTAAFTTAPPLSGSTGSSGFVCFRRADWVNVVIIVDV
jgi:hypothetical protein